MLAYYLCSMFICKGLGCAYSILNSGNRNTSVSCLRYEDMAGNLIFSNYKYCAINSYIGYTFCRKSKLSTHHLCIIRIPEVFTDGAPSLIYTYLHLPLLGIRTTNQTNITIPTRSCKKVKVGRRFLLKYVIGVSPMRGQQYS